MADNQNLSTPQYVQHETILPHTQRQLDNIYLSYFAICDELVVVLAEEIRQYLDSRLSGHEYKEDTQCAHFNVISFRATSRVIARMKKDNISGERPGPCQLDSMIRCLVENYCRKRNFSCKELSYVTMEILWRSSIK